MYMIGTLNSEPELKCLKDWKTEKVEKYFITYHCTAGPGSDDPRGDGP